MHININNLSKLKKPLYLTYLLILAHTPKTDVSNLLVSLPNKDEDLKWLLDNGYIIVIKGNRKDTIYQKYRITKKTRTFLNSLLEPTVLAEDEEIANWITSIYKSRGKIVKSGKKTRRLIAWFRENSKIEKNCLAFLIKDFISLQEDNNFEYSHDVNNVFWRPENVFQTRPNLDDSRLYNHYLSKREWFDKKFKNYE